MNEVKLSELWKMVEIFPQEKKAYEVLSLQRRATEPMTYEDYVEDCAMYVAKRIIILLKNEFEKPMYRAEKNKKTKIILEMALCDWEFDDNIYISWFNPLNQMLTGKIDIVSEFGYTFSKGETFFYDEWAELTMAYLSEFVGADTIKDIDEACVEFEEIYRCCIIID